MVILLAMINDLQRSTIMNKETIEMFLQSIRILG